MKRNDTPETSDRSASPRIKLDGAMRLMVRTIAPWLAKPSGGFRVRWGASAGSAVPVELVIRFAVAGDRASLRLSCEPDRLVRMIAFPQPRGGKRWLFLDGDGARCTTLLRPAGADVFRSRRELGAVSYGSQRRSPRRRAADRAAAIRVELRGSADISAPFPERPAGMRRSTYEKHRAEAEAAAAVALAGRPLVLPNHQEHRP